ncbi:MAG TPA: hydroxymethylglutaryl-CoA synthase, partial [Polyangia bacterium]|nr:hydroxymethylglutaryl-CoA synthase [Polyangia bacterium]
MVNIGADGVGIDGLSVYVPRLYVDLTGEWALTRAGSASGAAELVAKITKGIGVHRFAVPDAHEDSATMAAMAVARLIDELGLDPARMGYLAVGTETTVDQSKSIAAYVLGMLQRRYQVDLSHVGCPQFQFACAGTTYALEAASALIRAGEMGDRYAVVVATDISRYAIGGPAECTQGAGAVAMKVSQAPRLLTFDPRIRATVTFDERDFFRPNWSDEAVVDGQYSVDMYLSCLDAVVAKVATNGPDAIQRLAASDHFLFHIPFPRMAEYAATRLYRRLLDLKRGASWERREPSAERELDKRQMDSEPFRTWFGQRCFPALAHAGQIGNIYSGALY